MGMQYFVLFQVKLKMCLEIAGHDIHFTYMHFFSLKCWLLNLFHLKNLKVLATKET